MILTLKIGYPKTHSSSSLLKRPTSPVSLLSQKDSLGMSPNHPRCSPPLGGWPLPQARHSGLDVGITQKPQYRGVDRICVAFPNTWKPQAPEYHVKSIIACVSKYCFHKCLANNETYCMILHDTGACRVPGSNETSHLRTGTCLRVAWKTLIISWQRKHSTSVLVVQIVQDNWRNWQSLVRTRPILVAWVSRTMNWTAAPLPGFLQLSNVMLRSHQTSRWKLWWVEKSSKIQSTLDCQGLLHPFLFVSYNILWLL